MTYTADFPWCPRGCNWNHDGMQECVAKVVEQVKDHMPTQVDGVRHITITCPVCGNPIRTQITFEPVYECRKGEGWKSSASPPTA